MSVSSGAAASPPFPALIGDIGGTNARFAILADANAELHVFPTVRVRDFASIDAAIRASVLDNLAVQPRSAVLALAGPIRGERIPLTNSDWVVHPAGLIRDFGLSEVALLNDFEALALSLPELTERDYDAIGNGQMLDPGAKLVVGPGTGLGAAGLLHIRGNWIPVSGEGGHIELGAQTEEDIAIFAHLEQMGGGRRVSAEWVLSGPGLLHLYRAVAANNGIAPRFTDPAEVTSAGLAGSDPAAAEALKLHATYLGRYAGDLALIFLAVGGVYLAGGISRVLAGFLKDSGFRAGFADKWPHNALMESMATVVITHPSPALAGIAAFIRRPARFGLTLTGRSWRA